MPAEGRSIKLATVREQWTMGEAAEACLAQGITAIAPWRDQVEIFSAANWRKRPSDEVLATASAGFGLWPRALPGRHSRDCHSAAITSGCRARRVAGDVRITAAWSRNPIAATTRQACDPDAVPMTAPMAAPSGRAP